MQQANLEWLARPEHLELMETKDCLVTPALWDHLESLVYLVHQVASAPRVFRAQWGPLGRQALRVHSGLWARGESPGWQGLRESPAVLVPAVGREVPVQQVLLVLKESGETQGR